MSNYGWNDFWTTSSAENLRNQYRNLMNYLDQQIPALEKDFSNIQSSINNGFKNIGGKPTGSEGVLQILLLDSLEVTKKEFESILTSMDTAISELSKKQAIVRNRVEQLNRYCLREDEREKEYSYRDIHLD